MSLAIKAESISKKYIIGHQRTDRYTTMRDTMMHQLRSFKERFRHPLSMNKEDTDIEEFWALQNINFEIREGDRVGIIGRNGAGKSTLLKLLSRITEPTSGRITINGRVASLLEVGTGFHPELTGRENIFLNGAILGMRKNEIKQKFDEIVDFAEVEKFLDTPVKRYSSGMYVRLAFAVAAHLEPEILIVDEVLAVGDAKFQQKCLGKMESAGQEGRTVLFVSHNMGAINKLCTTGILLERGGIASTGDISGVISEYSNRHKDENTTLRDINEKLLASCDPEIIIESLKIITHDAMINTGSDITIEMTYKKLHEVKNPAFMVYIHTPDGLELTRLATRPYSGIEITSLKHRGKVALTIKDLPLLGGNYNISIQLTIPKIKSIAQYDNVATLCVNATDSYNSGFYLNNTMGLIKVAHDWAID